MLTVEPDRYECFRHTGAVATGHERADWTHELAALLEAIGEGGASAVVAASMFQFTEQTPAGAKQHLAAAGIPVRRPYLPGRA